MRKNQVVLIHGMPATGKYTMAKRLQQERSGILLDNHYFHDMFVNLIEKSEEELSDYFSEIGKLKKQFMKILARFYPKSKKVCYIFTSVMLKNEDLLERLEKFAKKVKGDFIPIELTAQEDVLKKRCETEYRKSRHKISNANNLEKFFKKYENRWPEYEHQNKLSIDTTLLNEDETFDKIVKHLEKFN